MGATTLRDLTVGGLLEAIAAKTPSPGGGAAASAVGGLGAALAQMVVSYSVGKTALAAHEPALRGAAAVLGNAQRILLELAEEDALAYGAVNELRKLPEGDARRALELPEAVRASVRVPLATAAACVSLLRHFEGLAGMTNRQLRSDLAIAAILAEAAVRASRWNVVINATNLEVGEVGAALKEIEGLVAEGTRLAGGVEGLCGA